MGKTIAECFNQVVSNKSSWTSKSHSLTLFTAFSPCTKMASVFPVVTEFQSLQSSDDMFVFPMDGFSSEVSSPFSMDTPMASSIEGSPMFDFSVTSNAVESQSSAPRSKPAASKRQDVKAVTVAKAKQARDDDGKRIRNRPTRPKVVEAKGAIQCIGKNRKKGTQCRNAALMEYIGPRPVYCAEHIELDPMAKYEKCKAGFQKEPGDKKQCKEVVLKEFGLCYKHYHLTLSALMEANDVASITLHAERVSALLSQLEQEAAAAKKTDGDLYQRKNKLIPKFLSMKKQVFHCLGQLRGEIPMMAVPPMPETAPVTAVPLQSEPVYAAIPYVSYSDCAMPDQDGSELSWQMSPDASPVLTDPADYLYSDLSQDFPVGSTEGSSLFPEFFSGFY